jgi:hypothetical protein
LDHPACVWISVGKIDGLDMSLPAEREQTIILTRRDQSVWFVDTQSRSNSATANEKELS